MIKILFLTRSYFPESSSGLNVVKKIAEKLTTRYQVDVYPIYSFNEEMTVQEYNKVRVFRSKKKDVTVLSKIAGKLEALYRGWPSINIAHIRNAVGEIKALIEKNQYDVLISVCHPFNAHVCAYLNVNEHVKWVAYYLDPYFSNSQLPQKEMYIRKYTEKKILEKADSVVLQSTVFNDYRSAGFRNIRSIEFPSIFDFDLSEKRKSIVLDEQYINCVYTGALYSDIRNPEYLLQLWNKLKNKKIRLYLIGGVYGFEKGYFELWQQKLGKQLVVLERMQEQEVNSVLDQADILINIGNSISNQLPGKVFDYISVRKPIVNLCKLRECPSLRYLQQYPICIHLFEDETLLASNILNLEEFIISNSGKQLIYKEIKEIYSNYTQDRVMEQFAEIIQSVLNRGL